MIREFSAGGAVLRHTDGHWWIGVIEPQSSAEKRARQKKPVIALPKGLVDSGERPEQTAVREVFEETGVHARLIQKLTDIRYVYIRSWGDGKRVFKIVSFYVLLYATGQIGNIRPDMQVEVRQAKWVPLEEAPKLLTHQGEREVARLALNFVAAHPDLISHNDAPVEERQPHPATPEKLD